MDYTSEDLITFDDTPETPKLSNEGIRAEARAMDISATTGLSSSSIMDMPDQESVVNEAKSKYPAAVQTMIDQSFVSNEPLDEAAIKLSRVAQQVGAAMGYNDVYIETALNATSPDYDPVAVNAMVNYRLLSEKVAETMSSDWDNASYLGIFGDFLTEVVRATIIGDLQEATGDVGTERGAEVLRILNLPPDEASPLLDKWLQENSESVFGNMFHKFEVYGDALNKGFNPDEASRDFWGKVGLFGTVVPLPLTAMKGIGVAKRWGAQLDAWKNIRSAEKGVATGALGEAIPTVVKRTSKIDPSGPNTSGLNKIEEEISVENGLIKSWKARARAVYKDEATTDEIRGVASRAAASFSNRFNGILKDWNAPAAGERVLTMRIQKPDGTPFNGWTFAQAEAKRFKEKGFAATPVSDDGGKTWFVNVQQNLDLTYAAPATVLSKSMGVIGDVMAKYFGSTRLGAKEGHLETLRANYILKGNIEDIKPYWDKIQAVKQEDYAHMSRIYDDLRDGADAAHKTGYTKAEFENKWSQQTGGATPSPEVWDAFNALRTVEDASYWATAQKNLRQFIRAGYDAIVVNGRRITAKPVPYNDIKAAFVYDAKAKQAINVGSKAFKDLASREAAVWELFEGDFIKVGDKTYKYVVNPNDVDVLRHNDVLNFNAGGRRNYKEAGYYATSGDGQGRAFMIARTSKEADTIKANLNAIRDEYLKVGANGMDNLTNELDNVIAANNAWNPSIEKTSDLVAFFKKHNIDLKDSIAYKAEGGKIQSNESVWDTLNNKDYFSHQTRRSDEPLLTYGGSRSVLDSGIKSIFEGIQGSAYQYSFIDATQRMKAGWIKAYYSKNPKGFTVDARGPNVMFEEAGAKLRVEASTPFQKQLLDEWNVINRRLGLKDEVTNRVHSFGSRLQEYVLDKTGVNTSGVGPLEDRLNSLGFISQFGFMNTSQFLVQASMTPSLIAIAGKTGLDAVTHIIPLRFALNAGGPAAAKRLSTGLKISERQASELMEYFYNVRPGEVLQDSIDKNTSAGYGFTLSGAGSPSKVRRGLHKTQQVARKASKIGLVPYVEGERMITYGSHLTAALEWIRKNPGGSFKSKEAIDYIMSRGSDLTFNMNTASRAAFQQGIWKVPTQWLAFSFRSAEVMFTGKVFSKAERARLAAYMLAASGASVFGIDSVADYVTEVSGVEPSEALYTGIKYGMYDGLISYGLSELTDTKIQTALGSRIAPFDGLTDLYSKLSEDPLLETALGPSGTIVFGGSAAVLSAIGNLFNGYEYATATDIERAVRSLGGVNNAAVVYGIMMKDAQFSREGVDLGIETNPWQGALKLLGIPSQAEKELYANAQMTYMKAKGWRAFSRTIEKEWDKAIQDLENGDRDEFASRVNELAARVTIVNASEYDKGQLMRTLQNKSHGLAKALTGSILREDAYQTSKIENMMKKDN